MSHFSCICVRLTVWQHIWLVHLHLLVPFQLEECQIVLVAAASVLSVGRDRFLDFQSVVKVARLSKSVVKAARLSKSVVKAARLSKSVVKVSRQDLRVLWISENVLREQSFGKQVSGVNTRDGTALASLRADDNEFIRRRRRSREQLYNI